MSQRQMAERLRRVPGSPLHQHHHRLRRAHERSRHPLVLRTGEGGLRGGAAPGAAGSGIWPWIAAMRGMVSSIANPKII